nr:hypothetical protein [Entomoplasma sp. MP1]
MKESQKSFTQQKITLKLKRKVSNIDAEIVKFENAINKSIEDLDNLKTTTLENLVQKKQQFF